MQFGEGGGGGGAFCDERSGESRDGAQTDLTRPGFWGCGGRWKEGKAISGDAWETVVEWE